MIKLIRDRDALDWLEKGEPERAVSADEPVEQSVKEIIGQVRASGDEAIRELALKFGDKPPSKFKVNETVVSTCAERLTDDIKDTIGFAAERIKLFAEAVMTAIRPVSVVDSDCECGLDFKPVQRAGCYVPGGRYPLPSTALMTAMTARVAGVPEICIFSPSIKDEILYAGSLAGVTEFYQVGGAQAIAAAAYGTESIKPVDIIVGPGNQYVTEAKRQLNGVIGIDMLAGPSEIAAIADSGANPEWLALDLLAQLEHDPESRAYLLTDSVRIAEETLEQLGLAISRVELPEFIVHSLSHSAVIVLPSIDHCARAANQIAPEHLQLHVADPDALKPMVTNYGALFLGYTSTVPFGDYVAGPNHTLPTNRSARFSGGLSPLTFLRTQSWIKTSPSSSRIPTATVSFATIEGLHGHAAAAAARLSH